MEKNIIFYFTGTGNSLQVAKIIASKLENCKVQLATTYQKNTLESGYERIGFVYPVYSGLPPIFMKRFIEKIDLSQNKDAYIFQVPTYGGSAGNAHYWMNETMKNKGMNLSASFGVISKPNYIVSYYITKDSVSKATKARSKAEVIAEKILKKKMTNPVKRKVRIFEILNKIVAFDFANMDKDYIVSDACVGCGICSKVCPVENIRLVNGKPIFDHRCEQCMACIHNCPKQAINYKKVTVKRNRYRNPEISLEELFRN